MNQENYSDANQIELSCVDCGQKIGFTLLSVGDDLRLKCPGCGREYAFTPELADKIKRFGKLLEAVHEARDILGQAAIGIKFKEEEVTVPYRLLLTRLNTLLRLRVDDREIVFRFRINPTAIFEAKDSQE